LKIHDAYYEFWAKAFGVSLEEIKSKVPLTVSSGHYVKKHGDQFVFSYEDLLNGKKILAGVADRINSLHPIENLEIAFDDIDYVLIETKDFKPHASLTGEIRSIITESQMTEFYADCSEDDKDTLDLNFDSGADFGFGLYNNNQLDAVARYVPTKTVKQVADLTMLVRNGARGHGFSSAVMSALIQNVLEKNLCPKYRVRSDNVASIAVAKKLGFTATHRLLARKLPSN
jgi:RimJ/RimL family protein N-acetyltransferase